MDSICLEKITEETFNLCQNIEHINPFSYPDTSGVVFRIENMGGMFALKGFACSSISDVFEEIVLSQDLKKNGIRYFETGKLTEAELICKNLFNRRFSLYDDFVSRGESWQLNLETGSITIHYYNRDDGSIPLGPLGDKNMLPELLRDLEGLRLERSKLSCKIIFDDSELEIAVRAALLEGQISSSLDSLSRLALLRRFWLSVEKELFCKNSMLH